MEDPKTQEAESLSRLEGQTLYIRCSCGDEDRIAVVRLESFFAAHTLLKAVLPQLLCTTCGQKDITVWGLESEV